jgi:hypothetical protein
MEKDAELYRKNGEKRTVIKCYRCEKKTMHLIEVDRTFISGDGCYYKCSNKKCRAAVKHIL